MRRPYAGASFKVVAWNVAGLNALLKRDPEALRALVELERPDVLCLQETKLQVRRMSVTRVSQ